MLDGSNLKYLEQLFECYKKNPSSIDSKWAEFFELFHDNSTNNTATSSPNFPYWRDLGNSYYPEISTENNNKNTCSEKITSSFSAKDSIRTLMLIRAFRARGHIRANLDPLGLIKTPPTPELDYQTYGFEKSDLDKEIFIDGYLGLKTATLGKIINILQKNYCSDIGIEFVHVNNPEEKAWIQDQIEGENKGPHFSQEEKIAILTKLIEGETFENFLDIKYTGTKRFGLEGAESTLVALEKIINHGSKLGIKEITLGMAHRGRLSVLSQIMDKPAKIIFHEFTGGASMPKEADGSGDVKYHLGASSDRIFENKSVHLSLTANPSHLEIVDPVVLGKVRAKQDQRSDLPRTSCLPLLLHGDAAFAGQGVVAECFELSGLRGHRTAGSVHFIINNQIGFTTNPIFSRSCRYPSDLAKVIEVPILHCNADNPEAVAYCAQLALEYRQKFKKPAVVDMICYRRHGHNETDEPMFTQPIMYSKIKNHPSVTKIYSQKLLDKNIISKEQIDKIHTSSLNYLENEFSKSTSFTPNKADWLDGKWSNFSVADDINKKRPGKTSVAKENLLEIANKITTIPDRINIHRTLKRVLNRKRKALLEDKKLDWSTGEALAFASLIAEGNGVRLSGQDCERGTFTQRHSVIYDQKTEERFVPLNNVQNEKACYEVVNSMLSEEAVLGFEYGYSLVEPSILTIWEAQFGDFANGAQVIFDQFIASGEKKWLRMSGLVVMLPHGYEGQGPEHSSARPERFLQMCAEDNIQVANLTTPANLFHALRRQLKRNFRKPLILFTPKSLLRHKKCTSKIDELTENTSFHRILYDDLEKNGTEQFSLASDEKIKKVLLCSGKVYYDLFEEREALKINDVYLLRIEQLYPFPFHTLQEELKRFPSAKIIWVQEEPKNMGSWNFVEPILRKIITEKNNQKEGPIYVGRNASAAPATGNFKKHITQLKELLNEAFK